MSRWKAMSCWASAFVSSRRTASFIASSSTTSAETSPSRRSAARRAASSSSASRTGAWLVPSSCAILVSTRRSPGLSSPLAIRWRRTSFTCSRRTVREMAAIVSAGDHRVGDLADAVDLDRDGVTGLEEALRVAEDADAGGCAGQDEIARLEGCGTGGVADDLVDLEDEVRGVRVLQRLARDD